MGAGSRRGQDPAAGAQTQQEGNGLGDRKGQPDSGDSKQIGKQEDQKGDTNATPEEGEQEGGPGLLHRPQEGGGDDVGPGEEKTPEVDPQPADRQPGQFGIAVPVEQSCQRVRPNLGDEGQGQPHQTGDQQSQTAELADGVVIAPAVGLTDKGLGTLGQAGEQGQGHQGQIGHDAVGGYAYGTGGPEHQGVVEGQHHAGGKLIEKGGAAQTGHIGQGPGHFGGTDQPELVAADEDMEGGEAQADHRGGTGSQGRAENTHVQRVEEEVVQSDIGQTAGKHSGHG